MELLSKELVKNKKSKASFISKIKRNSFYTLFFILPKKRILFDLQSIKFTKLFKLIRNWKKFKSFPNSEVCLFKDIHKNGINTVCFSPCEKFLAISSWETQATIYTIDYLKKLEFGKVFMKIGDHTNSIRSITFSQNGLYFATGSYDLSAIIYSFDPNKRNEMGKILHTFNDHTVRIYSVAFSPCSNYFASGADDKATYFYNLTNILESKKSNLSNLKPKLTSKDNINDKINENTNIEREDKLKLPSQGGIKTISFSHFNNLFATGSSDYFCEIYSYIPYSPIEIVIDKDIGIINKDNTNITDYNVNNTNNDIIKLDKPDSLCKKILILSNDLSTCTTVSFSTFGDLIVIGGSSGIVKIFGVNELDKSTFGQQVLTLGHQLWVNILSFSIINGQEYLACGSDDATSRIYKIKNVNEKYEKEYIMYFKGSIKAINSLSFSLFGEYFGMGSLDNTAKIYY